MVLKSRFRNNLERGGNTSQPWSKINFIEYRNNHFDCGDYEQQISLIDAYNSVGESRVKFGTEAVVYTCLVWHALFRHSPEDAKVAMKILSEEGLLELPGDSARAVLEEYALDESD